MKKATDTLQRDISGSGQTAKPLAAAGKPLLVQAIDHRGAPVPDVDVRFQVMPSYDAEGTLYQNGGLVARVLLHPSETSDQQLARRREAAEPMAEILVTTDLEGYAGAYYFAGRNVEIVAVSATLVANPEQPISFAIRIIDPRWGFLLWSGLLGGLAIFLLGLRMTSRGLEQAAGHRLRDILSRVTDSRFLGLTTGILVTALIQSSSATTVMVVSFTNAGLMRLGQTMAIILGADVGTTLTVQLIAFSLKEYSLLIVFAGFVLSSLPRRRTRAPGRFVLGFGLIFFGMSLMSNAMDPLRDQPLFRQMIVGSAQHPILVLLIATLFTGLIQSSAAMIGIALAFAFQGLIDLRTAIPVILGANIGTCMTACLAAIGTTREAQRVAFAHILFKVMAVLLFLPFLVPFADLVRRTSSDLARQVANAHTIFNVVAALIFLPFLSLAERMIRRLFPGEEDPHRQEWSPKYIDERILETPVLALAQVTREISRMGDTVLEMLKQSRSCIKDRDPDLMERLKVQDDKVDVLDAALRRYLTRLARTEMSQDQACKVASLLYMVHHLETIGDLISKNLMDMAQKVIREDLRFSEPGYRQWSEYYTQCVQMLERALAAFATNDKVMAEEVVQAKEKMSVMARNLHFEHLERLGRGIPESERTSDIHIHLISDLRRIMSNTVSIAAAVANEYRIPDLPSGLKMAPDEPRS